MSEEKRFTKKKTIIEVSVFVVVCVLAGVLGICFVSVSNNYVDLSRDYDDLYVDYLELLNTYQILTGDYDTLFDNYNSLEITYNSVCNTIKQTILPVQYSIFAEAVRRYYMPIYLGGLSGKSYWMAYAEFSRDMILHDSGQYNAFSEVSNAFSDALKYGSNTMDLAYQIMYWTFYDWLPNWDGFGLYGDELTNIDTIVDWCIDEIDYEYDSDITTRQEYFDDDYPKFPVETAFRTMGDCEDQAILTATYLESCGFETTIMVFHDPSHPTLDEFYHCVPLVHIEDTDAFKSLYYPECPLWRFTNDPYYPDYTWSWLDTTWDVPFGTTPSWLDDYGGSVSFSFCSIAYCDIDGVIGTNVEENIGIEYFIPT